MEFQVLLTSVADVKRFVDVATAYPYDVDVSTERYIVNGKSIMGLFSIDLSAPIRVEVHGTDAQGESFRRAVGRFVEQ